MNSEKRVIIAPKGAMGHVEAGQECEKDSGSTTARIGSEGRRSRIQTDFRVHLAGVVTQCGAAFSSTWSAPVLSEVVSATTVRMPARPPRSAAPAGPPHRRPGRVRSGRATCRSPPSPDRHAGSSGPSRPPRRRRGSRTSASGSGRRAHRSWPGGTRGTPPDARATSPPAPPPAASPHRAPPRRPLRRATAQGCARPPAQSGPHPSRRAVCRPYREKSTPFGGDWRSVARYRPVGWTGSGLTLRCRPDRTRRGPPTRRPRACAGAAGRTGPARRRVRGR